MIQNIMRLGKRREIELNMLIKESPVFPAITLRYLFRQPALPQPRSGEAEQRETAQDQGAGFGDHSILQVQIAAILDDTKSAVKRVLESRRVDAKLVGIETRDACGGGDKTSPGMADIGIPGREQSWSASAGHRDQIKIDPAGSDARQIERAGDREQIPIRASRPSSVGQELKVVAHGAVPGIAERG